LDKRKESKPTEPASTTSAPTEAKAAVKPGPFSKQVAAIREAQAARERELETKKAAREAKKATRPWADNRWKTDMLRLEKKPDHLFPYWVPEDQVQDFLRRGWDYAIPRDFGEKSEKMIGEDGQETSVIRRRELILLTQPMEHRQEYLEYRNEVRRQMTERDTEKDEASGLFTFTDIDEERALTKRGQ
jgi:hypothetical protein